MALVILAGRLFHRKSVCCPWKAVGEGGGVPATVVQKSDTTPAEQAGQHYNTFKALRPDAFMNAGHHRRLHLLWAAP